MASDKPWEKGSKTDRSRISNNKSKNAQSKIKQGNKSDVQKKKTIRNVHKKK